MGWDSSIPPPFSTPILAKLCSAALLEIFGIVCCGDFLFHLLSLLLASSSGEEESPEFLAAPDIKTFSREIISVTSCGSMIMQGYILILGEVFPIPGICYKIVNKLIILINVGLSHSLKSSNKLQGPIFRVSPFFENYIFLPPVHLIFPPCTFGHIYFFGFVF